METAGRVTAILVMIAIVIGVSLLVGGFFLMLALGILSSELGILQPIGYWSSVAVAWALGVVGGIIFTAPSAAFRNNKN